MVDIAEVQAVETIMTLHLIGDSDSYMQEVNCGAMQGTSLLCYT